MPRLSAASLATLPEKIGRPQYDRAAITPGIVHFGLGAFHRAHQAWYTDRAIAHAQKYGGDTDWGIVGVSLRSQDVAQQINPQDGLYTIIERSASRHDVQVIGSLRHVLVAGPQPEAVVAALAATETRLVTFTVTERGYCRSGDGGLDRALAHDGSIYFFLAGGLRRRMEAGLPGLTLLSCDNLAHNGRQLERLLAEYLGWHDPDLAHWVADACQFPCSMVDRIVPATVAANLAEAAAATGLHDAGAVVTEPFSQWVIEDRFAGPRPEWEAVGAEMVSDIAPYETAKLRMLNGAHSALAYLGLERGHQFVHQAVADPVVRPIVERLMRREALPTIRAAAGQDLHAYADALLDRFANPALHHQLIQIAMDGSEKIPQRFLETLAENEAVGNDCPATLAALAAWLRHIRGQNASAWGNVDDPKAQLFKEYGAGTGAAFIQALFGADGLFSAGWRIDEARSTMLLSLLDRTD